VSNAAWSSGHLRARAIRASSLRGATMLELSETAFGHDLAAILKISEADDLNSSVSLSTVQKSEICKATTYYNGKPFEYPDYAEAISRLSGVARSRRTLRSCD
jgi:hypothetical protein